VIPPIISQPKDLEDVSTIESSFQNFDSKFNKYNLSGNDIQTLNLLGAVAAGFKRFPFIDQTTSEVEVNGDTESINIDTSGGGPVFVVYQEKTVKLLQLVKSIVTPGCTNSIDRFKLTDIQQIFSTFDALTRFEPYLSLEGVKIMVVIVDTVIDCLEYGSRRNPLSPTAVESLSDIAIGKAVSNYLRNPYIYGENATKATSSVPVINIPQNISVDTNIPNKGNLEFKRYIPLINPRYPEQMIYFAFEIINGGDAVLIYIKPDEFDFLGHQEVPLYSFYFSSATFPKSDLFDYKKVLGVDDWTGYGFKVFLPGGICGEGLCYLGIKPLTAPDTDDFSGTRKRRAAEQATIEQPENTTSKFNASDFVLAEANFSMIFTTTGCRTWEKGKQLMDNGEMS
ncbi:uncharacterized protein LOC134269791, partial [Saccostrea cucullata]|uniref:uncharacterized protein LOC134269791 n=1 Tax=Saccostrea cuccullata TaxID=36930 RepID=UPI002ED61E47